MPSLSPRSCTKCLSLDQCFLISLGILAYASIPPSALQIWSFQQVLAVAPTNDLVDFQPSASFVVRRGVALFGLRSAETCKML